MRSMKQDFSTVGNCVRIGVLSSLVWPHGRQRRKLLLGGFGVGTLFPSVLSHGLSSNFEPTPRRDPVERFAQPGHKYRKFIQIRGLSKTDPNTAIMVPLRIKVLKYATPKLRLLILATTSEYGVAASALQGSLQS